MFIAALVTPTVMFLSWYGMTFYSALLFVTDVDIIVRIGFVPLEDPLIFLFIMPLRFVFPHQIMRYYQGRVSRKRAMVGGIVSDLPFILLFASLMVIWLIYPVLVYSLFPSGMILMIPVPTMFVIGSVLLVVKPVPELQSPWE